jgi:hypothetical protein
LSEFKKVEDIIGVPPELEDEHLPLDDDEEEYDIEVSRKPEVIAIPKNQHHHNHHDHNKHQGGNQNWHQPHQH